MKNPWSALEKLMIQSLLWGFPYWIYQNQREAPAFPKDASSHDFARGDKIAWRDAFSATKGVCSCDQRFKPNCLGTLIYLDALHESLLSVYWYHRHTFTILYIVLLLSCWYYPVVCQWIYYLRLKFVGKITGESVWVFRVSHLCDSLVGGFCNQPWRLACNMSM